MSTVQTDELKKFEDYLFYQRGFSAHTVSAYLRDVRQFMQICVKKKYLFHELKALDVRLLIKELLDSGIQIRSIRRKISANRCFFDHQSMHKQEYSNPFVGVRFPTERKRHLPNIIDVDSIVHFLDSISTEKIIDKRDKCMMELFYASGLRLSELHSLNVSDALTMIKYKKINLMGKGRKERLVPVGDMAIDQLKRWLTVRLNWVKDSNEQGLWLGVLGSRLGMRSIQGRIAVWGKRLKLPVHLHPHLFRHSAASHLLQSSQNLRMVQTFLGHENISTTQLYTHLDFQYLSSIYDQHHPRSSVAKIKKSHE